MKRARVAMIAMATLAGCTAGAPQVAQQYQSRALYMCCNIYHESAEINDANYHIGTLVPVGTAVTVEKVGRSSVTFSAGATNLTLSHDYGTKQESLQQFIDKVLVAEDPKARIAGYPTAVREAIGEGRVERGMTKEQVILAIGYPPLHRTASLNEPEWLYWYNRWVTYKVAFDSSGVVANVIGRPAPTKDQPIVAASKHAPKPAKPARKKSK